MIRFAHPMAFRASAFDGRGDEWASDALHLRVRFAGELGFPIHPFAVWPVNADVVDAQTRWVAQNGSIIPTPFDPGPAKGAHGIVFASAGGPESEWYWLSVDADAHGDDFAIDLLDRRSGRILATRHKPPFEFGGTAMCLLQARGRGEVRGVRGVPSSFLSFGVMDGTPAMTFGLPIEGSPWYAASRDPLGEAKERLVEGAMKRLGPVDRPAGLFDPLVPDSEAARVLETLAPAQINDWLASAFLDPTTPPPMAVREGSKLGPSGQQQKARYSPIDALLTMAVDPDIARYLGLATARLAPIPAWKPGPNLWLVAGRWSVKKETHVRLHSVLQSTPIPSFVANHLNALFPGSPAVAGNFLSRAEEAWEIETLVAIACAAANSPPDVPSAPGVSATGRKTWFTSEDGTRWSQTMQFQKKPLGMVAAARIAPAPLASLHEPRPDGRFAPLLAGTDSNGICGVSDTNIPDTPPGATWNLWQSDEWGRWSEKTTLSGTEPDRPFPPSPGVEDFWIAAAKIDDDSLRSPGVLRLRVAIPLAAHTVPGGSPIAKLQLSCPNVVRWRLGESPIIANANASFDVAGETALVIEAEAVDTPRAGQLPLVVTLKFLDGMGQLSEPTVLVRNVCDPRPPKVIITGPRLIWASVPDPTGWSEISLEWDADPVAAGYRVYLGDERRLSSSLGMSVVDTDERAKRARLIWERRGDLRDKGAFSLLSEELVKANGAVVRYNSRLPGKLRSVQFIRVVPVGANGAESNFAECGLSPVAIPDLERPPTPVASVRADTAGSISVVVQSPGLRSDLVDRGAPTFRVRRTCTAVSNALYMPIVKESNLSADGTTWIASFTDGLAPSLPAYVRQTYVAEVRYAPERDLDAGAVAIDGSIRPGGNAARGPYPSAWSDPSLPCSSVVVPATGPDAPAGATAISNPDGTVAISVPALPLHKLAIGTNECFVYRESNSPASLDLIGQASLQTDVAIIDTMRGTKYRVVISDPTGRYSRETIVSVSSPP
jgi:hypothetical protein